MRHAKRGVSYCQMVALRSITVRSRPVSGLQSVARTCSDHRCGGSAGLPDFPFNLLSPPVGVAVGTCYRGAQFTVRAGVCQLLGQSKTTAALIYITV
jgi:hypothetical protein